MKGIKCSFIFALFISSLSAIIPEVKDLSLEQKVGQLLICHFHGTIANDDAKTLIKEIGVGGIIYFNFSNDLSSPEKVFSLSHSLQKIASIPLLIAIDQEGGRVARLSQGFTKIPANKALGETNKQELAFASAFLIGQELKAVGINMNLAPVVDIDSNPLNTVIGCRSFGNDPQKVSLFGKEALRGYHEARIITSLKHFPGHGDTVIDSHKGLPILNKSLEELDLLELVPFKDLQEYTDTIMTAHLMVPALDTQNCVTLSKKIIEGLLRKKIGFKGVVITDSLIMQGVLDNAGNIYEAAVRAIEAGSDLLILGGRQSLDGDTAVLEVSIEDVKNIRNYIILNIEKGRISMERIEESVERVLKLKKAYL